jgi:hypothetical protein
MSPENRRSKESLPKAGRGQETQRAGYLAALTLGVATAAAGCNSDIDNTSSLQYGSGGADDAGINTSDVSELQTSASATTMPLNIDEVEISLGGSVWEIGTGCVIAPGLSNTGRTFG